MESKRQVFFLTFSDSRFKSWKRLGREASITGWFDSVTAGDERLLEKWYLEKYKERFKDRGFGYWQWKSYLIRKQLDRISEGDVLLYCDGGCTINRDGHSRFLEYVNIVTNHPSGVLLFDTGMNVREWTKGDVFQYFGNNLQYTTHTQAAGTTIMICKNALSCAMIDEWFYICHNHYNLLNDSPSIYPNYPEFIENRHDQSILDLLSIKYEAARISINEVDRDDHDWTLLKEFPIWATRKRDRKTNLIRRVASQLLKVIMNIINAHHKEQKSKL